ncbi:MAG: hypothetical protein PHR87_08775 [Sulfurospirillaceae bacterium]|nr:hypothetical protein [Sulfurospirillaceae bacterium]
MTQTNLLTIQQYAIKHKLSAFSVVKLINTKKLQTIKKIVDGEEKEFIIDETANAILATPKEEGKTTAETPINYEIEFHKLLAKHLELQDKYDALLEKKELL